MPAESSSIEPQQAKAQKTSLTSTLATEFDRAMTLLEDRLDGLMEQFRGDGSSFYDDYQNARKHHRQLRPRKKKTTARRRRIRNTSAASRTSPQGRSANGVAAPRG